ncbi:MAG: bifunctional heptose 7-phosphate kinase/heptose 1-phosphate adenyltransferase, partial [Synergistaceae bacterium]|nr:bifunctional heptose 7-phosphate kinase/heptose 1-phosphate adenyltransferase [Synergistaceae bacterium]
LGVKTSFIGRAGNDREAECITKMLCDVGAEESNIAYRGTSSVKTRLLGNGRQQMIRLDYENIILPLKEEHKSYIESIEKKLKNGLKAVILSDYGKGMFLGTLAQDIIKTCAKYKVPVLVDPKGTDWNKYSGAFVVTPNLSELAAVSDRQVINDDNSVADAGKAIKSRFKFQNLIVTRSEKGATLISSDEVLHVPAFAVEVFDVSGAGDTVIAVLSASVAAGLDIADSVRLANMAGQVVVGKVGTTPIERDELLNFFAKNESKGKLMKAEDVAVKIQEWQKRGEKVIFTNGCFDIFHAGHVDSLAKSKALGEHLVVGLNSDSSIRLLKGPSRPVNLQGARASVLSAMSDVDIVVIFDEETPEHLLSILRPDVIAKGGDYSPDKVAGGQYAKEVVILPLLEGLSTTSIIERMNYDGNK